MSYGIEVYGLKDLRAAFKAVAGKAGTKRLAEAYREVSDLLVADTKRKAASGTPLQRKNAKAVRRKASVTQGAGIAVFNNYNKVTGRGSGRAQLFTVDEAGRKVKVRAKAGQSVEFNSAAKLATSWVAFWGVNRPLGWFANQEGATAARQHLPTWVGNQWKESWERKDFTEGPYVIREAVRDQMPHIEEAFADAIARAAKDVGLSE